MDEAAGGTAGAVTSRLDHVAINVGTDLDRAEALFAALGFTMTPRGHHSLGSMNHLMLFDRDYLELIAVPDGSTPRPDLRAAPIGINGIVFATDDVDAVFARLDDLGLAGDPPRAFHRPVEVGPDGDTANARFRTVTVRSGVFPGGRVYFCHHLTPELVWQPDWQRHPNGATGIAGVVVVSTGAAEEAARFAALIGTEVTAGPYGEAVVDLGSHRLTVLAPDHARIRYGDLAPPMGGRPSIFGAVELVADDPSVWHRRATELPGVRAVGGDDRTVVRVEAYDTLLDVAALDVAATDS